MPRVSEEETGQENEKSAELDGTHTEEGDSSEEENRGSGLIFDTSTPIASSDKADLNSPSVPPAFSSGILFPGGEDETSLAPDV
jgi:hypothetical protein